MDLDQPQLGKVPDLTGLSGKVALGLTGRRSWRWRFLGICLLAAVVGSPAGWAGGVYPETSPSAKVRNTWLTAHVSVVPTTPTAPTTPTTPTAPTAPTITFDQPPDVTVGMPVPLTASVSPPGPPVLFGPDTPSVCTVAGTTVTTVAVGTCTVTAHEGGDPPRTAPDVTRSFKVNPVQAGRAPQTITFGQPPDATVGTPVVLSARASSGLAVLFSSDTPSVCTVAGSAVTTVAAGPCTITASQSGSARYAAAPDVTRSFQENPATSKVAGALVSLLAAAAVILTAAAAAATLAVRRRRLRAHPLPTPGPSVRAVPYTGPPGLVSVRTTGTDATHTVRIETSPGTSVTTIEEASP